MKKTISAELIATIVVAVLALGVAIFAIVMLTGGKNNSADPGNNSTYVPSAELLDEMKDAATQLVQDDYAAFKLFYTKGLPVKEEPYGNKPDDGSYTVNSSDYKTYSDIETFIKNTFVEEEAQRILTNAQGDGVKVYVDEKGALGLSVDFKAMEYTKSWEQVTYKVEAVSDTDCRLTITIHDADGKEVVNNAEMQKQDGKWLLCAIVY